MSPHKRRKILYYRNPMGLPDTSPVPKKDPMGMHYIPIFVDEDKSGVVEVSPARRQMLGVRTALVTLRPELAKTIRNGPYGEGLHMPLHLSAWLVSPDWWRRQSICR